MPGETLRVAKMAGLAAAAVFVLTACDPPVADEIFVVDTTNDSVDATPGDGLCADAAGDCSLRAAVMEGNADANITEIQVTGGETYSLTLLGASEDAAASGDLDLLERTYLRAMGGTGLAVVDGNSTDRVIDARSGNFHYLERLEISGGDATGNGGGIRNAAPVFAIEDSHITNNVATISGGGIANTGGLWIENSTISGNAALLDFGGGIFTTGYTRLFQATVGSNVANNVNADISTDTGAMLYAISSTLTGDEIAIELWRGDAFFDDTIAEGGSEACDIAIANVTSNGGNIESDATCGFVSTGDLQNTAAVLNPLADNGGPVVTRLPGLGSPAIEHTTCPIGLDARGLPRPSGFFCDTGAVEVQEQPD